MDLINKRVVLRKHAVGTLTEGVFDFAEEPVRELRDGEALVANIYATVDPSQSRMLRQYENYVPSFAIGGLIGGYAVGQIVRSRTPAFKEGDFYSHFQGGWESHSIIRPLTDTSNPARLQKADPALGPLTLNIGALGSKGFTAYIGVKLIGRTQPGDTAVISAAAGAVGSTAGQLARHYGATTVGIAGGPEKARFILDDLHLDAAVDYKAGDVAAALDAACPYGIDVFLDNVGGEIQRLAMERMRVHGRFAISGMVSDYGFDEPPAGPNLFVTIRRSFLIHGFLAFHFMDHFHAFREEMSGLVASGAIVVPEDIVVGLDNGPGALIGMLSGNNVGQRFLQIADDPTRPRG